MTVASNISAQALDQALAPILPKSNPQYRARLVNQILQLIRHGNYAETFIRTTPEGTDLVNFARLWEYVLVQADRQSRGYVARNNRNEFEATRKDFEDAIDMMAAKLKSSIERHDLDLSGTNFISRIAQRYQIVDRKRGSEGGEGSTPRTPRAPKAEALEAIEGAEGVEAAMPAPKAPRVAKEKPAAAPAAAASSTEAPAEAKAATPKRVAKPKAAADDSLAELEAL